MTDVPKGLDYFGEPLPDGYDRWVCSECTAACTFEAMTQCHGEQPCPYFREGVEANHGAFALIRKHGAPVAWTDVPARICVPKSFGGSVPEYLRARPVVVEARLTDVATLREFARCEGFSESTWFVDPQEPIPAETLNELRELGYGRRDEGERDARA